MNRPFKIVEKPLGLCVKHKAGRRKLYRFDAFVNIAVDKKSKCFTSTEYNLADAWWKLLDQLYEFEIDHFNKKIEVRIDFIVNDHDESSTYYSEGNSLGYALIPILNVMHQKIISNMTQSLSEWEVIGC